MTIAKDFASKLSVAFVAAAMLFSFAAPTSAQTTEDLQQMINDLLAQIAQLEGATTGLSTGAGSCVSIMAPLTIGSTGADVTALQNVLISNGYSIPAGATGYFGTQTQAALAAWQADSNISPAVGYYGPISKAALDASCVAEDEDEDEMDEDEDDSPSMTLSGEGVLSDFEIDDEEDEVQEGAEDEVVATITLSADDGDIEIDRMYFTLASDGGNEENDAYDVFEEVSLWVDGDKIADFDASDEDDYRDEDLGTFIFSGLDLFVEEDEDTEVLVAVTVMNSVDGADVMGSSTWTLTATEVRYFDADGVATNDDDTDELGDSVTFDIVEAGIDDEAEIKRSSDNPDETSLLVDDGRDDSDEYTTHIFEIEVGDDSSDLEVEDVWYAVTITNPDADAITGGQRDVIDEITMTIDGETVTGEAVDTGERNVGPDRDNTSIAGSGGTTTVHYLFEFDGDVVLEADETYEVEITMTFKGQDGNYANGVTVEGVAPGAIWEVVGVEDDNILTGSDSSEAHILSDAVASISNYNWSAPAAGNFLDFTFTVDADDNDFDVLLSSFDFATSGTATTGTPVLTRTTGDAEVIGGGFRVLDGDTASFRIRFDVNGANGAFLDVTATSIAGQPIPDDEEVSPTVTRNIQS